MGRPAARTLRLTGLVMAAAALLLPTMAQAKKGHPKKGHAKQHVVGHVYTQTNDLSNNEVVIFNRLKDGSLAQAGSVTTNGTGAMSPDCSPPGPVICPFNDSNGSLRLSPNGRLLFVTNGGSNTISTFIVRKNGLKLASVTPSGGGFPLSTTMHGNVLYVLNYDTGNIKGFRVKNNGHLRAINGATQSVSTPGSGGHVGQIGFDRSGRTLIVSERGPSLVDTFVVNKHGVAGPATAHSAPFPGAYGFDITPSGHIVMSDGGPPPFITGAITSWALHPHGGLSVIQSTGADPSDPNNANPPNHGAGSCWTVITPDHKYAYVTNSTAKTISRVKLDADGHFTVLGLTTIPDSAFAMLTNIPADEGFSPNGKVLYVTVPSLYAGNTGRVDAWSVHKNGDLTLIGSTPSDLPAGAGSGIAVN